MAAAGFRLRKIKTQPLLGQQLSKARKKFGVSLEEVEENIKVRAKYLEALENGDYRVLPSNVYVKGFLQSYCGFLGLNFYDIYEMYQKEGRVCGICVESGMTPVTSGKYNQKSVVITSKTFIWPSIVLVVMFTIGYIFMQVSGFASAPKLSLVSPQRDMVVTTTEQMFEGQTDAGASVTINGQRVSVDETGHFKEDIKLMPGLNTVELIASNKTKKETKKICVIEVQEKTALK